MFKSSRQTLLKTSIQLFFTKEIYFNEVKINVRDMIICIKYCEYLIYLIDLIGHGNPIYVTDKYSHLSLIDSCHIKRKPHHFLIKWGTFR